MGRLLAHAESGRDVLPRPSGGASFRDVQRFELLEESS
jgi:hypothetical protein